MADDNNTAENAALFAACANEDYGVELTRLDVLDILASVGLKLIRDEAGDATVAYQGGVTKEMN